MAQKRKSLKKSFRKSNRSTRRKSKTNKRKSRKIRGGEDAGDKLVYEVIKINYLLTGNKKIKMNEDEFYPVVLEDTVAEALDTSARLLDGKEKEALKEIKKIITDGFSSCGTMLFNHGSKECQQKKV